MSPTTIRGASGARRGRREHRDDRADRVLVAVQAGGSFGTLSVIGFQRDPVGPRRELRAVDQAGREREPDRRRVVPLDVGCDVRRGTLARARSGQRRRRGSLDDARRTPAAEGGDGLAVFASMRSVRLGRSSAAAPRSVRAAEASRARPRSAGESAIAVAFAPAGLAAALPGRAAQARGDEAGIRAEGRQGRGRSDGQRRPSVNQERSESSHSSPRRQAMDLLPSPASPLSFDVFGQRVDVAVALVGGKPADQEGVARPPHELVAGQARRLLDRGEVLVHVAGKCAGSSELIVARAANSSSRRRFGSVAYCSHAQEARVAARGAAAAGRHLSEGQALSGRGRGSGATGRLDDVWSEVDSYLSSLLVPPDAALEAARRGDLPSIEVSALQGKFLYLLGMLNLLPRAVLELGTLGGYSTIWLARAWGKAGGTSRWRSIRTTPRSRGRTSHVQGLASCGGVTVGPALETLPGLYSRSISCSSTPTGGATPSTWSGRCASGGRAR